jgi:hypothetical protein
MRQVRRLRVEGGLGGVDMGSASNQCVISVLVSSMAVEGVLYSR